MGVYIGGVMLQRFLHRDFAASETQWDDDDVDDDNDDAWCLYCCHANYQKYIPNNSKC